MPTGDYEWWNDPEHNPNIRFKNYTQTFTAEWEITMTKQSPEPTPTKTYILDMARGAQKRVTVPAHWRVTFGPVHPGSKGGSGHEICLRFYENTSKDTQRACFVNVEAFRDADISVVEKVTRSKRQTVNAATDQGGRATVVEATVEEWVNPDDPDAVRGVHENLLALDFETLRDME